MRRGILLAGLFLVSSLAGASSDFDPKEPISMDLKDAKVVDVVHTLGAIANLPVILDPDVQGTVTIQLHGPFDVALQELSAATGLSIRIENGRLVVSRGLKAMPATPPLPDEFRNARRIPLSEYHRAASSPPPLFVRVSWRGSEECYRADFRGGEGRMLEIPLWGSGATDSVVVALVDYDPIFKTSYVAVESPGGGIQRMFPIGNGVVSFSSGSGDARLRVVTSTDGGGGCREGSLRSVAGASRVTLRLEGRSIGEGKASRLLLAPRLGTKSGTVFKTLSGGPDPDSGPQRGFVGFVVAGYVARNGKAVALLFKARTTWTDPRDGLEYYFTQSFVDPESRFVPLTRDGVVAARLSPGVATAEPVELRIFGEE